MELGKAGSKAFTSAGDAKAIAACPGVQELALFWLVQLDSEVLFKPELSGEIFAAERALR